MNSGADLRLFTSDVFADGGGAIGALGPPSNSVRDPKAGGGKDSG